MTFASFLGGPGGDSFGVPLELFRENRRKLTEKLQLRLEKERTTQSTAPAATDNTTSNGNGNSGSDVANRFVVVLNGGPSPTRYDTDHEPIFRQESYFWWLTGVKEPDCALVMVVDDGISDCCEGNGDNSNGSNNINIPATATTVSDSGNPNYRYALFVPRLPDSYATIMGKIRSLDRWKEIYGVDGGVYFADTLEDFIEDQLRSPGNSRVLLMHGLNSDSGMMYEAPKISLSGMVSTEAAASKNGESKGGASAPVVDVDTTTLFPILADCRVFKSDLELDLLEHVTMITSFAHAYVMRNTKPGMAEYQCESLFKHYAYYNYGSRLVSYTSICGCGPNSAILHYGHTGEPNSRRIEDGDHCLHDMGAEYQCYASDVTCSFPANGMFTEKYKAVYESVLNAQRAVYAKMEPGVSWMECHIAAELEIVEGLCTIGVIKLPDHCKDENGERHRILERLVREQRLGAVFMPHGLGHLIGIDTHDVGGYIEGTPQRSNDAGLRSLRTARILEESMVLTVEPGCYFIDHLLDEAMEEGNPLSEYLNRDLIDREYRGYGGVRLEDVVVVTAGTTPRSSCVRNFTLCPRTVGEVEAVMSGGKWPPTVDEAPELRRLRLTKPWSSLPAPPSK